jgi:hypothetical protein
MELTAAQPVEFNEEEDKEFRKSLLIALILFLLALWLSFDDGLLLKILSLNSSANSPAIGKITESVSDVRQKLQTEMIWLKAEGKQTIHDGDSLFAGEKSTAEVGLDNGVAVTLEPNSLVLFQLAKGIQILGF